MHARCLNISGHNFGLVVRELVNESAVLVVRATMTNCCRGRFVSAWRYLCLTSETIGAISRTHSDRIQQAPASRNRNRRWTSPAAARCSRHTQRSKTRTVPFSSTTCFSFASLSTLATWWIREYLLKTVDWTDFFYQTAKTDRGSGF